MIGRLKKVTSNKKTYRRLGIFEIILGILIIFLPLLYFFTTNMVIGYSFLLLGIVWLFLTLRIKEDSRLFSVLVLLIGIMAIISAISLLFNMVALEPLLTFWILFAGLMLIIFGLLTFQYGKKYNGKWTIMAIVAVILGLVYIILGWYELDPYYLAFLIGIFLVADGSSVLIIKPQEIIEPLP